MNNFKTNNELKKDKERELFKKALEYFKGDELATNVWKGKYALDNEATPDDMHKRMAKEFARIDKEYQKQEKEFSSEGAIADLSRYGNSRNNLTSESIYNLFKDFKYIVPQGSIMYGLGRTDKYVSLSNCFFIGAPTVDSYGGIMEKDEQLVQLMKRRSGVGIDISSLRPRNTIVSNSAGTSTGAASFMERFSNSTREVGQENRRGALLISIDSSHPDVEEFIVKKSDKNKVTGANVSVKIDNKFMDAVINDKDYILTYPSDLNINNHTAFCESLYNGDIEYGKLYDLQYKNDVNYEGCYAKRIKAKKLWDIIIKQARDNSEPGLLFWDNVVNNGPDGVYEQYKPSGTNPCGEITLSPMDSCRLMLLNLYSFVDNPFKTNAKVDFEKLYEYAYENQRLMDNLVDLEIESVKRIIDKIKNDSGDENIKARELNLWEEIIEAAKNGRRTGSGITALGDMLAALNLKYDSDEGIKMAEKVMHIKMKGELDATIDLAITRGHFKGWNNNKEYLSNGEYGNNFFKNLELSFPEQTARMKKYGRRNVSWSTISPAGSVSILTKTTSGCEPLFKAFYIRRKKINHSDTDSRVDFIDDTGDKWQEFSVLHPKFKEWININFDSLGLSLTDKIEELDKNTLQKCFEKSPWYGSEADDINWIKRVKMQSVLQSKTSHSISSTINLPENVTEEEVHEIYLEGWKQNLKGLTIYRDGSRTGVLVNENDKKHVKFEDNNAFKRPKDVDCFVLKSKVKGVEYKFIIGLIDERPYETFIHQGDAYGNGIMRKKKKGEYIFIKTGVPEEKQFEEKVSANMTPEMEAISRMASWGLRHGGGVKHLVNVLRTIDAEIFEFVPAFIRALNKFIKSDDLNSKQKCPECDKETLLYEEGCSRCLSCGYSACN